MTFDLFIVFTLLFIWMRIAFVSLLNITKGKIRKIDTDDKITAQKLEHWLQKRNSYKITFPIVNGIFLVLTEITLLDGLIEAFYSKGSLSFIYCIIISIIVIAVIITVAESLAKFSLNKFDIYLLKLAIPIIALLSKTITFPSVRVVTLIENRVETMQQTDEDEIITTEDEIMSLIENDELIGSAVTSLEEDEKLMIKGIFELNDTSVREIMTPRVDVIGIPAAASPKEAVALFISTGHSRIPIYNKTVDEITGVILAKDFLVLPTVNSLQDISHKPIYIPESKGIGELLTEFRKSRNHFSVVIDEYGGTAGIVTLEDIIEEIVGEIHDEHDKHYKADPIMLKDGSFVVDARISIDEINELLHSNIPEDEDFDTLGGLVSNILGRIPDEGEEINIDEDINVKIIKADERRVLTFKIKKNSQKI